MNDYTLTVWLRTPIARNYEPMFIALSHEVSDGCLIVRLRDGGDYGFPLGNVVGWRTSTAEHI